jgi:tRNA (guanosine-2'-O-)-methyltransferase
LKENRNDKIIQLLKRRQPDLTVLMDEVHKPHNLAAIVRTCDAVGIGRVHAVYPQGMLKECHGTASGSNRWVDVKVHDNLPSGVDELRRQGKQILAAHFSERAVDYRQIDYTKPTTLIVGSEKIGVSEQAAELADEHVLIPMLGMVQSLNVSVASAIILYEAQRQRELAGLYDKQHLSSASFERLRFEWLHPQVKEFCLKHKIRYPKIDEQGDIRDEQWNQLRQSVTGY